MKTERPQDLRDADYGGDDTTDTVVQTNVDVQRSPTGRALHWVSVTVGALAVILLITAVAAWVATRDTVDEPTVESAPLLDQSVRARDGVANPRSSAQLRQEAQAAEHAAMIEQRNTLRTPHRKSDAQLRQEAQAAEHAALIEQRNTLRTR